MFNLQVVKKRDSSSFLYHTHLERPINNVVQMQILTFEILSNQTHMTVEPDVNDRIWFSEGLKLDLGEPVVSNSLLKQAVDSISGLDMRNNQICLRESDTTNFTVDVPAYLCPITSVDGATGIISCQDSDHYSLI